MLISVIIPAYNCKATLTRAVESVLSGKEDTQVIIIDDGSVDETSAVIKALCGKYKTITALRKENSGPAFARNDGMALASGEYIMFLDSDDYFEKDTFRKVADALEDKPDMLIFGFRQSFEGKARDRIYSLPSPFDIDLFYKNNLLNQVWNKAYKRSFLQKNEIEFMNFRYGEDRIFNAHVLEKKPRVSVIEDVLYNYRIDNSLSLISGYIPEKIESCKIIYNCYSNLCEDKNTVNFMFLKNILSCMTVLFAGNCPLSEKQKKEKIRSIICDEAVIKAMESPQTGANELIRRIIKTKNVFINYYFSFFVSFVQKNMLPLFLKFRK